MDGVTLMIVVDVLILVCMISFEVVRMSRVLFDVIVLVSGTFVVSSVRMWNILSMSSLDSGLPLVVMFESVWGSTGVIGSVSVFCVSIVVRTYEMVLFGYVS